jgi:hypothetical protein
VIPKGYLLGITRKKPKVGVLKKLKLKNETLANNGLYYNFLGKWPTHLHEAKN